VGLELLSVIIPTAGRRWEELRRCLYSIEQQDRQPAEVIVLHNHGKTIPNWLKSGVINVRAKGTIYEGFNAGVKAAQGPWLMMIGDDDRLPHREWLKNISKYLRLKTPWNYVYHRIIPTEYDGSIHRGIVPPLTGKNKLVAQMILQCRHGIVSHSGAAYRKSLHDEVGPYPEHLLSQGDTWWLSKASLMGRLKLKSYYADGPIVGGDNAGQRVSKNSVERARAYDLIEEMVRNGA